MEDTNTHPPIKKRYREGSLKITIPPLISENEKHNQCVVTNMDKLETQYEELIQGIHILKKRGGTMTKNKFLKSLEKIHDYHIVCEQYICNMFNELEE